MAETQAKDKWLGIAEQGQEKLFERYYRVENKQTEKIPGFGTGEVTCPDFFMEHNLR
jgi:signal transduction histidine kinase